LGTVVDGELVAFDGSGYPSFNAITSTHGAEENASPVEIDNAARQQYIALATGRSIASLSTEKAI
jgi:hypothetical protein